MHTPEKLLAMDEVTLAQMVLNEVTGSRQYDQMYAAFSLKLALKNQETADDLGKFTKVLADSTVALASSTKTLVYATWAIAAITLLTQIGLIVLALRGIK
jgi:hypothetical protein